MTTVRASQRPALDPIKETPRMPKRFGTFAALIGFALLLLAALPISASAAPSPWWQVLTGSRPTNMWEPSDNVQEIETELGTFFGFEGFAAEIEVSGKTVGCLGTANFVGSLLCQNAAGFPPVETAAQLEATLEAAFGTSEVEVSGGPVGGEPFVVTVPDREASIRLTPISGLGSSEVEVLSRGGSGRLVLTFTNLGDAPVDAVPAPNSPIQPVTIVDQLPEGVIATGTEAVAGAGGGAGSVDCSIEAPDEVICNFEGTLPSYEAIEVEVLVSLTGSPPAAGAPGEVTISGGNAPAASGAQVVKVSQAPVPFGLERFSAETEEEGGAPARQAGGHPFQFTTTLQLNSGAVTSAAGGGRARTEQPALPRNLESILPPGLIGNATVMPRCDMAMFFRVLEFVNRCPDVSVIGAASVTIVEVGALGFLREAVPVFNLPPAPGEPARFGFIAVGVPVVIDTSLDPDNEYRIVASVNNVTQLAQFLSSTLTLWGTPGDPRHDSARGWDCVYNLPATGQLGPCERPDNLHEAAFLRQPVSCASPLNFGMQVEPWNVPVGSVVDEASFTGDPLLGCNRVPFDPSVESAPTSKLAENPSGLSFNLSMPNSGLLNGDAIAEGQPKKVEVTLPEGMTLNPSAAEGLAVCTPADYARETFNSKPGAGCPNASKIGNVEIDTPLIEEQVKGALYMAAPHDNPFDSLLALYIVARVPERGILVKLAGKVEPDPKTGQIVTIFDDAPQTPFTSFDLSFREGGRAPLVTPPACGSYDVVARFVPWSAQDPNNPAPNEVVTRTSSFEVQRGVDGGACPSGGVPPFEPGFEAGSLNNNAKSYSPFYMRLIREDGEQNMTKFSSILPPGVLGKLAGVAKCSDAAIEAAKGKTGKEELASPSCPSNSQIGRVSTGAGVGSVLTYVGGSLYLGGSYKGAPLSVVAVVPAVAGPFDVGTVVTREALTLNPETAEVEVDGAASDPIPHILAGIPLKVRDLRVYVDRDNFILNPTSCDPSTAKATLFGSYLDLFSPADDVPAHMSSRFQAANCLNLGFKPKLKLNLKGGTKRGDFPGLRATLKARGSDANIAGAQVTLPRSAFLEQGHIGTICTRVQFKAENCPKASVYGHAKATTPLLDQPIEGPVYMRSSNHKLPDLVIALKGIVDVNVSSRIDSFKGGLRSSFESVPDAPISSFVLTMKGGKKGLIVNSRNLCAGKNRAKVTFTAQNGRVARLRPEMKPRCGKARKRKK
jgi:hypothetical protein